MKAVGYTRLSKAENGHGIKVQREAIAQFCERKGIELVRIEEDDGASGRTVKKRPGLAAAIEACRSREVEAIIATRVDRVARSSLDFHKTVEAVQRAKATILFTEQESFSLDSPEGRMLIGILSTFAAFEADLISARTKAGLAHVKKHGSRSGRPIGNPNFKPAPLRVVRSILKLRDEGLSYRGIADKLNESNVPTVQGGKRWGPQAVANIAKREAA